jgi:hypothetical protein
MRAANACASFIISFLEACVKRGVGRLVLAETLILKFSDVRAAS